MMQFLHFSVLFFGKIVFSFKTFPKNFSVFLLGLICFSSDAQVQMSKALPQPKFYLIGVEDFSFPIPPVTIDDSSMVIAYGLSIEKWIEYHSDFYKQKLQNPTANVLFTYLDFAKLSSEQKSVFKKIIKELSPVLRPQRTKLLNEFNKQYPDSKGVEPDFINDAIQVYFLNKIDLEHLINELNK